MKSFTQLKPTPCFITNIGTNRQVLVKDESACPNYTFKDRLGLELAKRLHKVRAGPDMLVSSITMGNTAFSLAWGMKLMYENSPCPQILAVFPKNFHQRKLGPDSKGRICYGSDVIDAMRNKGICCYEYDLTQHRLSAADTAEVGKSIGLKFQTHLDVTEGISEPCYSPLFEEAFQQAKNLKYEFDTILVPVGAGVLFETAVAEVTKREKQVNVVGISVLDEVSIADKIWAYFSPYYSELMQYRMASSIVMPKHKVYCVTDSEIKMALKIIRGKFEAEPSAAAAFALLERKKLIPAKTRVLVINTGNGFLWAKGKTFD